MTTYNAAWQITNEVAKLLKSNKTFDELAKKAKYEALDDGHIFIWKGISEADSSYLYDLATNFPNQGYRQIMTSVDPYNYYNSRGTLHPCIIETSFSIGKVKER